MSVPAWLRRLSWRIFPPPPCGGHRYTYDRYGALVCWRCEDLKRRGLL